MSTHATMHATACRSVLHIWCEAQIADCPPAMAMFGAGALLIRSPSRVVAIQVCPPKKQAKAARSDSPRAEQTDPLSSKFCLLAFLVDGVDALVNVLATEEEALAQLAKYAEILRMEHIGRYLIARHGDVGEIFVEAETVSSGYDAPVTYRYLVCVQFNNIAPSLRYHGRAGRILLHKTSSFEDATEFVAQYQFAWNNGTLQTVRGDM